MSTLDKPVKKAKKFNRDGINTIKTKQFTKAQILAYYTQRTGRPTEYRPEYAKQMIDYFKEPITEEIEETMEGKNWSKTTKRTEAVKFPTFERFASIINTYHQRLVVWSSIKYPDDYEIEEMRGKYKYPDFKDAYTQCKDIQKSLLIEYSLLNKLNDRFAMFFAINNHDMVNRTLQDVSIKETPKPLLGGNANIAVDNTVERLPKLPKYIEGEVTDSKP